MSSKNEYIYHATLVMSKLKKFDLKFLKVNRSIDAWNQTVAQSRQANVSISLLLPF